MNDIVKKALHDFVLLKEVEEEKEMGGIILADGEASKRAKVIAKGDSCVNVDVEDIVLFDRQCTTSAFVKGEDYLLIKEANIFCIL